MRTQRMIVAVTALAAFWLANPAVVQAADNGPPGLFSINLGLSIWTIVVFLVLLALLKKFAWGPILASVEEREHGIQSSIDEAAKLRAEAIVLMEEHKKQMDDSRRQAQQIIAEGREAGENLRREIEEEAKKESQRTIERARVEIMREKDAAVAQLHIEAVEIALAAAAHLIEERLDSQADKAIIDRYLAGLEPQKRQEARA